jgi:Peptidase family M28
MLDRDQPRNQANPVHTIILLSGILILVIIGVYQTVPPKPSSISAPKSAFSSAHAMSHVRQIGSKPHPTGSPENAEVRQYLTNRIMELGFTPEIQSTFANNPRKQSDQIQNVLVKIPGTKSGKALLLVAHYDSVPTGPGAADNGASVAAILETLRALKTQSPLQNDLICLFTDGEELGLLGAKVFVEQHPWAKEVGLALNFEYRGNSGAFMMFETSDGNGKLIAGLATSVGFIMSSSLMYEVYKRLPNDTDFTVFKRAGILGMNFAAIEGHKAYHSRLDRPELLNQGTLQHEGEIMMALVRHFGNKHLDDLKAENLMYFDFPGLGIIHYPMRWTVFLCSLLAILFAALCIINHKAKSMRIMQLLISVVFYLLLMFVLYVFNNGLWTAVRVFHPAYQTFAYDDTLASYCYLIGLTHLNILITCGYYLFAQRWLKPMEINLGIAVIWLLLALLTLNNGVNFLFTWPLLAFLVSLGLIRLSFFKNHPVFNALMLLGGSAPGILIFTPLIKNLFVGLTPSNIAVILIPLNLLLGLLFPVLGTINSNKKGIVPICTSS